MGKGKPHNKNKIRTDNMLIYGQHAVKAAVQNRQRKIYKLLATDNGFANLQVNLQADISLPNIPIETVTAARLSQILGNDAVHQGVLIEAAPLPEPDLPSLIATGKMLIILDQVTDPRNVGAILRAAAVFGAGALIMTARNSPTPDGALAKAASGALDIVPLATISNLARGLQQIAAAGYVVIGLDERGDMPIGEIRNTYGADQPLACVLGAEGKGLRRLTKENCTILSHLPHAGASAGASAGTDGFTTLNVSTAAAVMLYALNF